ncbi:MAG: multicopper oxidase family protein [Methylophilaceae bacterium]
MRHITNMTWINKTWSANLAMLAATAVTSLLVSTAHAAAPGVTGPNFDLTAAPGYITQPDGSSIYSWGFGCYNEPSGFAPLTIPNPTCSTTMQLPGPTLIVTQGQTVKVTLHNNLPPAAGNTSILFPGFNVSAAATVGQTGSCTTSTPGVLTTEVANGCAITYTFVADTPGTHTYYSGTQGDLQIEMGLYGALIVLPSTIPDNCKSLTQNDKAKAANGESDFRLAAAAYNHPAACYDREYLFQFSEIDPVIHRQAAEQAGLPCTQQTGCMVVATEPYLPAYFMVNGRSMPDLMDPNYAVQYPHQPYNGNPHMHPGELVLLRIIGNGRWQHPFHEHGNHVRVLARDGNMLLTPASNKLAGPLLFTTTTTPGQTMDGIFQWTGKGLNWDVYAHTTGYTAPCVPDADGYFTADPTARNYYEWCADHEKALESKPYGQVGGGGPVTLPDANIMANGAWYGGSPYLGPEATQRAVGGTPIPPSGTVGNSPTAEAGFAFMWHSHNEREITTNNAFPGGMMMMMLVDPRDFKIIEAK